MSGVRRLLSSLVVSAAALCLFHPLGCAAAHDEEAEPGTRQVRLHGVVTLPDGAPAAGQEIVLDLGGRGESAFTTRADGSYSAVADVYLPVPGSAHARVDGIVRTKLLPLQLREPEGDIELDIHLLPVPVVTGRVLLPNGKPAGSLTLRALGGRNGSWFFDIVTDADGRYRLPLPEGHRTHYKFCISQKGIGSSPMFEAEADFDNPVVHHDIHLQHGGAIEGNVIAYPGRTQVTGAKVLAAGDPPFYWRGPFVYADAVSDEHGRFHIAALPPGEYRVGLGFEEDEPEAEGQWPEYGYGLVGDFMSYTATVQDPQIARVDLRVARSFELTGRVYRPDGSLLRNADLGPPHITTDADGRYTHEVKPWAMVHMLSPQIASHLTVVPRLEGVGVARPAAVNFLEGSPQQLDIHLLEPGSISGKLVSREGRLPPGVNVRLEPVLDPDIAASGAGRDLFYDSDTSKVEPDEEGAVAFRGVVPGNYLLGLWGCTVYQRDKDFGGRIPLTVSPGETIGPVTVEVRPKPCFRGHIFGLPEDAFEPQKDNEPLFFLDCILRPTGSDEGPRKVYFERKEDNRYLAWTSGLGTGFHDIVFQGRRGPRGHVSNVMRAVAFDEGAVLDGLDFTLAGGASISGRAVQLDGRTAIGDIGISLRPLSGDALMLVPMEICGSLYGNELSARTSPDGEFHFTGLLPGEYGVAAAWPESWYGESQTIKLRLAENEQRSGLVFRATRSWP